MDGVGDGPSKCMWTPDPTRKTNVSDFRESVNEKFGLSLKSYEDLYDWSVEEYPQFWEEFWHYASVVHSTPYDEVIDKTKNISEIPEWFHGSRLNFAENLLKFNDDQVAVYAAAEKIPAHLEGYTRPTYDPQSGTRPSPPSKGKRRARAGSSPRHDKRKKTSANGHATNGSATQHSEGRDVRKRTFAELRRDVAVLAAAMRKAGVTKGDRVAGYLPNCLEAVEAMLAATSIGAIWSSVSPDFGVTGVVERLGQVQPKLMVTVNAVVYNGKVHDHMGKLSQVIQGLTEVQTVVVIPYVLKDTGLDISSIKNSVTLDEFLRSGHQSNGSTPELVFEQVPFNHPLFIMFSSGTTGAPKCMIHSVGGTLMKHLAEHLMQGNMKRSDVLMYYTTTGWMMWNWFVSALATGAAIVCYDGSPLMPTPNVLWDVIDDIGVTVLGTGAKWLSVIEEKGVCPRESHQLKHLHTILSTGSPLKPASYDYVYNSVKSDLLLGSITGGTDIIGCFAGHSNDVPVYRGEIQCRMLGMAMECWDENGKTLRGESGELVCTQPFPSMPTRFWNDDTGAKYKSAYFSGFPSVWTHGDFCLISPMTGGIWMLGRSDGTLNPSGVRFGSAEIYHVVESFKEIQDSLCVSQRSKDMTEERVILFLQMTPDTAFNKELVKRVCVNIRSQLSARHVPAVILETTAIPYTQSGKKVEVAVKKILAGSDVKQRGAYLNPESLDVYYNIPELQGY